MPLPDAFAPQTIDELVRRIESLKPDTQPLWGKMSVAQMLAHCQVIYKQVRGELPPVPWLMRLLVQLFIKRSLVSDAPFKRGLPTATSFVIKDSCDFARERDGLVASIRAVHGEGRAAFENRSSPNLGPMTVEQWSNLLYKHLDHHLRQFGA